MKALLLFAVFALVAPSVPRAQCELQIVDAPLASAHSSFGWKLAIDGDTALVGAPSWSDLAQGTAYVLQRSHGTWFRTAQLSVSGRPTDVAYADEVALAGDLALIGSTLERATYVFERQGGGWVRTARLPRGGRLGISGNQILVATAEPSLFFQGEVHVFQRTLSGWSETQVLTAPVPASQDGFGQAFAVSGSRLLASQYSTGVLEFERSGSTWVPSGTILPPAGAVGFGYPLALDGTHALVGALGSPFGGPLEGAYYFERGPAGWSFVQHLVPRSSTGDEGLLSIALAGDFALIGSPANDVRVHADVERDAGTSWLFVHGSSGWIEAGSLADPLPRGGENYGTALALEADGSALIGAPLVQGSQGSVHAWQLSSKGCASLRALPASVSLFQGGSLELELQAPLAAAGSFYLVLGSENGTTPGTRIGSGLRLPLNPGFVFATMRRFANSGPFVGTLGNLDANAAARATISIPRHSDASLLGLHLNFAFLTAAAGGTGLALTGASNAVALDLLP